MGATPQASASSSGNRVSSLSFTLTIPAGITQGVVLVGISTDDTGGRTVSSVTVGGSAATSVHHDGGSGSATWIYRFISGSSTGAKTIAITLSGAVSGDLIAGATVFDGADQTTPVGNATGGSGTSAIPTLNVTSSTNDAVFDCVHANGQSTIAVTTAGGTQQWNVQGPRNRTRGGGSTAPGAASVAMSWSASGSTLTSHSAVNVVGAAASGGISGESDGVGAASGTIEATGALSGSAAGVASSTATLSASGALAGESDGVATATGSGIAAAEGSGSSAGTATAAATIEARGALAGTAAGTAASTATLSGAGALAGESDGVASSTAHLVGSGALAGEADGVASTTAHLTGAAALAGEADGVASSTATLSSAGSGPSGSSAGVATATGTLTATGALAGEADGVASTSALLTASGKLLGTIIAGASSTAQIEAKGALAGEADGSASCTATLTGSTVHVPLRVTFKFGARLCNQIGSISAAPANNHKFGAVPAHALTLAAKIAHSQKFSAAPAHKFNFGTEV